MGIHWRVGSKGAERRHNVQLGAGYSLYRTTTEYPELEGIHKDHRAQLHTGPPKNLFLEANRDKVTGPGPRVNRGNADGGLSMLFSLTNYIQEPMLLKDQIPLIP